MSSLIEGLMGQFGGSALKALSSQLGADEKQTQGGIAAALPLLMGALSRNSKDSSGASALNSALDSDHDGSILDDVTGFLGKGDTSPGLGILKHVLGGKQSRVESGISKSTGMNGASAGKLLALVAPMVLGALGKAKREKKMDTSGLTSMLGQERDNFEKRAPQQMGALNMLLDADGDGDVDLGDIVKRGGGLLGKLFGQG